MTAIQGIKTFEVIEYPSLAALEASHKTHLADKPLDLQFTVMSTRMLITYPMIVITDLDIDERSNTATFSGVAASRPFGPRGQIRGFIDFGRHVPSTIDQIL